MAHMRAQIVKDTWHEVEDKYGASWYRPEGFYDEDTETLVRTFEGYGARLSAPGYLDCTDWAVFATEAEAAEYLLETYYDQDVDYMDDDEREDADALQAMID